MNISPNNNPITIRLKRIQELYNTFQESQTQICHWLIAWDEVRMIDAFYTYESSEHHIFQDVFLQFIAPFENEQQYNQAILKELRHFSEKGKEEFHLAEIPFDLDLPSGVSGTKALLYYFIEFANKIPSTDGNLVLWFNPNPAENFVAWEQWLINLIQLGLPDRIQLMLVQIEDTYSLDKLKRTFPNQMMTIRPQLNMEQAIQDLAASGNPQLPDVKFRTFFTKMGIAARKGNLVEAEHLGKQALNVAQQQMGWEHLEVGIYTALGAYLISSRKRQKEAIHYYEKAYKTAQRAVKEEHPSGIVLLIQATLIKASGSFILKKYDEAAQIYQNIPKLFDAKEEPAMAFYQLEAYRMAGFCYQTGRKHKQAWNAYWNALETATLLDPQTQAHSTIPYIGQGLLEVMHKSKNGDKERHIRNKMIEYVGEDWESKLETKKQTQV